MPRQTKVMFRGELRGAVEMEFSPRQEPWNTYTLPDGGEVRVRVIAMNMYEIVGEKNEDLGPFIYVKHVVVVTTSPGPAGPAGEYIQ